MSLMCNVIIEFNVAYKYPNHHLRCILVPNCDMNFSLTKGPLHLISTCSWKHIIFSFGMQVSFHMAGFQIYHQFPWAYVNKPKWSRSGISKCSHHVWISFKLQYILHTVRHKDGNVMEIGFVTPLQLMIIHNKCLIFSSIGFQLLCSIIHFRFSMSLNFSKRPSLIILKR